MGGLFEGCGTRGHDYHGMSSMQQPSYTGHLPHLLFDQRQRVRGRDPG